MMEQATAQFMERLKEVSDGQKQCLIAIDGRCGAGKTTLAEEIQKKIDCNVFHMDHFFLRPEQRTKERLMQPGGNIDHERFLEEVLLPLKEGKTVCYRPYDCHLQDFREEIRMGPKAINLIEGSYSCHSALWAQYDLRFFLSISPEIQLQRIRRRNGEKGAKMFEERWIPLEERYFAQYELEKRCDMVLDGR